MISSEPLSLLWPNLPLQVLVLSPVKHAGYCKSVDSLPFQASWLLQEYGLSPLSGIHVVI